MSTKSLHSELALELSAVLSTEYPGMEVDVSFSRRWDRPCVTFTWAGFADLLPEERFHRLVRVIPSSLIEEKLAGFVWVELAPNESLESFLAKPRSEDVANRETEIYANLMRVSFFSALGAMLGSAPKAACKGAYAATTSVLSKLGWEPSALTDAKLLFIRYGAYCDCQALQTVKSELARQHAKKNTSE